MAASLSQEEWDERSRRLEAARAQAIALLPKVCPACRGDDLLPLFELNRDLWECLTCSRVFERTP
jgi:hypothetical protein